MKVIKLLAAIALLPLLWSTFRFTFFTFHILFQNWNQLPWKDLFYLGLGISTWIFAFFSLPRPMWFYVFGHEATHALVVWLTGGKVSGFKVSSSGGHVISDKISTAIALAPYVIPFYPLLLGILWWILTFFWEPLFHYSWIFLILWGASWGFHFSCTLYVLRSHQPDFESQGYFFSIVFVLLLNLFLLLFLICFWLTPFPIQTGIGTFFAFLIEDYYFVIFNIKKIIELLLSILI